MADGRYICATESDDPGIPAVGESWGLVTLWDSEQAAAEGEFDDHNIEWIEREMSDEELVTLVTELVARTK